jgi:PAS domain S-box-containing protein
MEDNIKDSERRFQDLVEQLPVIVFETDMKACITFVNAICSRISGYNEDEIMGRSVLDFIAPEDSERGRKLLYEVLAGKNPVDTEFRLINKDASRFSVLIQSALFKNSLGQFMGLRGIMVDNSRQKNIEYGLRESEAFSTSLFINSPNPILVINPDYTIRKVNPAFEVLTGYFDAEVLGAMPPYPWWPVEQRQNYDARWNFIENNTKYERYYQRKNGEIFWVVTGVQKVFDKGHMEYFIANWVDISLRKRMEEQNIALYEKEKQQRETLQEEARVRGMFIDVLAHELRTPLTPIMASTSMLKEIVKAKADTIQKKLTDNIYNSTQIMARRLEELLELASYSRGTFSLNIRSLDLDFFIKGVISRFKPLIVQKGQKIIEEIPEKLAEAEIDAYRLELVMVNLLSNASKFSPDHATICLKAITDNSFLQVDVQDCGPGIPPELQNKLFLPYHRVEQDRQQFPGIGLGLAVAKQIIEAHGGNLWLESQPGRGSTFSFRIPLKRPVQQNEIPLPA